MSQVDYQYFRGAGGDAAQTWPFTPEYPSGTDLNLVDGQTARIRLMRQETQEEVVSNAVTVDGTNERLLYDPTAADLPADGDYDVRWQVLFAGEWLTFPNGLPKLARVYG